MMKSTTTTSDHHHLLLSTTILLSLLPATASDDGAVMAKLFTTLKPRPPGWTFSSSFCEWSGIKCDGSNRVIFISLASKSLSGSLPAELNQLSNLQTLSLQNNLLGGDLPLLANLSKLQEVFLDGNTFKSIPPKFFSGLTSLQTFSISENYNIAPWSIPNELADCTGLMKFYAHKANVMGTIPDFLATLPSLQSLRLSYNNLTGTLPASFANSGIQDLRMNNQMLGLSGRIDVLGTMTQLSQVWLQANAFSGSIPDMSKCASLFDLQLRDNQITGVVPPSLWSLPKLINVSLQNNMLQGPYPQVPKGVEVTLGKANNFCNAKPGPCDPQVTALLQVAGGLGYPMALAESWKGNDACNGWDFISCDSEGKSVIGINIGKQRWSGSISPSIANLSSLRTVHLNDNDLTGGIPKMLTTLKDLQVLDVSNNNLTGKVPEFASTVKLNTSGNPFIGMEQVSSGSGDNSSSGSTSGASSEIGGKSGPGGGSPLSSLLPGVIVGIVIGVLILGGLVSFLITKYCMKNRKVKFGRALGSRKGNEIVKSSTGGNMNVNGGGQSRSESDEIHVHDGGNVVIPIEVLRDVTNNFGEDKIIGRGGFGVVYKGELHDGTQIAVKRMESNILGTKGLSEFHAEISVLTKVRHRHLVALLGYCVNGHERLVVYEYMPQGTLGQHLFECSEFGFSLLTWKQRVTIALDVARGIEYLHNLAQESFIHRDLKPSNILLGDDFRAKVSDFGLVKNAPDGTFSVETRLAGTFGYLAPEYATTGRVTTKVDVFAFGVVLMEILTGRKALDENQPEEKIHLVTWFRRILLNKDIIPSSLDPSLNPDDATFESIWKVAELAGHCTAREPYQRPDMGHAVSVLVPLVEQWRPTVNEEDGDFGLDLDMSLPQALQRWQYHEGTSSLLTADFYNSQSETSMPPMPSGFADPLNSNKGR